MPRPYGNLEDWFFSLRAKSRTNYFEFKETIRLERKARAEEMRLEDRLSSEIRSRGVEDGLLRK